MLQSLKYFLEQILSSPEQHKWAAKFLGYDYDIVYKNGKDNVVEDALSRKIEDEGSMFTLSSPVFDWLDEAKQEWLTHPTIS